MRTAVFAGLAALAGLTCGCTTAAKQALYELRGARGKILWVSAPHRERLARIRSLVFEPATTTIGDRLCPVSFRNAYDRRAGEQLEALRTLYPGGEPRLRIEADVLYFQKKGLLSEAQSLTRVRMRDDLGLLADGIVRVESKSFRAGDEEDLAEETVDAICKFLRRGREQDEHGD